MASTATWRWRACSPRRRWRELKATSGSRFDRLFLRGMIAHHQGAVDMAQTVAVDGTDLQVSEIAADVSVGQQAEINRMRDLLRDL